MSKTKVKFTKNIGSNSFEFECEVESQEEFFQKTSFFSSLPSVGPNGEDDLVLQYRKVKDDYEFYSIVSEKAGKEFKFGSLKSGGGELFPKGWEDIYVSENADESSDAPAPKKSSRSSRKKKVAAAPTPVEVDEDAAEEVAVDSASGDDVDDLLAGFGA